MLDNSELEFGQFRGQLSILLERLVEHCCGALELLLDLGRVVLDGLGLATEAVEIFGQQCDLTGAVVDPFVSRFLGRLESGDVGLEGSDFRHQLYPPPGVRLE